MDIERLQQKGVENCDKAELIEICEVMGIPYHHNNSETTLRDKILVAWGEGSIEISDGERVNIAPADSAAQTSIRADGSILPKVNLSPNGAWGGRRETVTLANQDMEVNKEGFPQYAAWDSLEVFIPFDVQCDVPYPIFISLQNAEGARRVSHRVDRNSRISMQHEWKTTRRFAVNHAGTTKGTENLPTSLQDHFLQPEILSRLAAYRKSESPPKLQLRKACQMLDVAHRTDMKLNKMTAHEMIDGIYEAINYDPDMEEAA